MGIHERASVLSNLVSQQESTKDRIPLALLSMSPPVYWWSHCLKQSTGTYLLVPDHSFIYYITRQNDRNRFLLYSSTESWTWLLFTCHCE